jgi:hypothetical protein
MGRIDAAPDDMIVGRVLFENCWKEGARLAGTGNDAQAVHCMIRL